MNPTSDCLASSREHLSAAGLERRDASSAEDAVAVGAARLATIGRVADLSAIEDELASIQIPSGILAVAGEIADGSDVPGIETTQLELLVRFLLWSGRAIHECETRGQLAAASGGSSI